MRLLMSATIASVTVYPGQARVTRRGVVRLPVGEAVEVVVDDLPLCVVHESVRVSGRGAGSIVGVDVATSRHSRDESKRVAGLLAERQRLVVAAQELDDRRRALDLRISMLESIAVGAGRPYARQLATAEIQAEDVGPVAERLADQLAAVLAARRPLLDDEARIADDRARVDRELATPGTSDPDRTAVVVSVVPGDDEAGEAELEVSYLVDQATWEPRYDIRLDGSEVELTWYGMVRQWSGEQWPPCELRLSTARPTASVRVPDLDPWFLTERVPYRPVQMAAMAAPELADAAGAGRPLLRSAPMAKVSAVAEQGVTATTYAIRRPVAVPSDGSDHQALITSFRLPARVDRVTAPVLGDDVYLRATATNRSEHTLRAGRASLFHGTEFVGVCDLDVVAVGEEVELALGLDDRVRVERELVARTADKAFLGGAARHEARWRTTVANHTGTPVEITVLDQVPVSKAPGITVKDVTLEPAATVDDVGQVTWRLSLPDGAKANLSLGIKVEVAKGVDVAGWRD